MASKFSDWVVLQIISFSSLVKFIQLVPNIPDGGIALVGLADDVRGGALHRVVGLRTFLQVFYESVVLFDLISVEESNCLVLRSRNNI